MENEPSAPLPGEGRPVRTVGESLQVLKRFPPSALLEIEGKKHNYVSASLSKFATCSVCKLEGESGDGN